MPKLVLNKDELEDCTAHGLRPTYQLGKDWGICDKCLLSLFRSMSFTICDEKARFIRVDKLGNVELALAG
jgi:hypothetical protein